MSAFNNLIEQVALKEKLVKVQLKTDPAFSNLGNISKFQGYIGYILRENRTSSKVFLEQNGAVIIVPNKMIEPVQNKLSKVDRFKLAALKYLKEKRDIKQTDTLTKLIINCNSIEYVESFCIDNGCTQNDIKNIYKLAFNSTINEGAILNAVGRGLNAVSKFALGFDPSESWLQHFTGLSGGNNSGDDRYKIPAKIKEFIRVTKEKGKEGERPDDLSIESLMDTEILKICDSQEKTQWTNLKNKKFGSKAELISAYLTAIHSYI